MQPDEKTLARLKPGCICKGIKLIRLIEAIENGADTYEKIARATGIGGGSCKGRRCGEKVAQLLKKSSTMS
ncbi:MAG TPA: (2Fe-2S)-binding protein [Desulfobulbaceae bacterium]|nr:(2Fe-2S)-binding protein [Desulfobulbaceae bacterium]